MPHLWMFLLKALTPPEHEVILMDGNAKPMNERELVRFVREQGIGSGGYRRDDADDSAGLPTLPTRFARPASW